MKKINAIISDEANDILEKFKVENKYQYKENALDNLILQYDKVKNR